MPYSKKVIEQFRDTSNYGSLDGANAVGKVGNARCGDVMWIYLKVEDDVIVDAKFETFGCVAAIAASSVAIDMIKGKTLKDALSVSNKDVIDALGGLPPQKIHCSVLAEEGIRKAIEAYRQSQKA